MVEKRYSQQHQPTLRNNPQLSTSGFELAPRASMSLGISVSWNGRVWARTECSIIGEEFICLTGDCGRGVTCDSNDGVRPATQPNSPLPLKAAKIYTMSALIEGFNILTSITAHGRAGHCRSSNCLADINMVCPIEL